MKSLTRLHDSASTALLMRILEQPKLVAAVRELPGAVLGKLIDRIGLEDAGELVTLANEAGEEALVQRLCELPEDLVALAVHRLVLVLDQEVIEEQLRPGDDEAEQLERALDNSAFEEWEEFRIIARDPDTWDDVWNALMALDRDHYDRLRAILERCCEMTTEYISGQGGLFQVLTANEMLDSDIAAARDDRRSAEGFVSPADARAFLELVRRGGATNERDPITRAYFRDLARPSATPKGDIPRPGGSEGGAVPVEVGDLAELLREAKLIATPTTTRMLAEVADDSTGGQAHLVAPLFEQAMIDLRHRDPVLFSTRASELGYLVNVWIVGGAHQGRRPRPTEALELVLKACQEGMQTHHGSSAVTQQKALAVLTKTSADRRGFPHVR